MCPFPPLMLSMGQAGPHEKRCQVLSARGALAAWSGRGWKVRTGGGPDGRAEDRASEHRRTQSRGLGGPGPGASVEPHEVAAGRGPPGPGRPAGGAERHPGAGPGAGPARPDDGLAVHLLPGRGQDHGGGPGGHAGGRAGRPAVRRRAPVELRRCSPRPSGGCCST